MTQRAFIRTLLLVLVSFSVTSLATAQKSTGIKINAKKEKFSITMPRSFGAPKRSVEPLETDAGKISMISYLATNDARGACMVMYGSYPKSAFEGKTSEKMLDDARDSAMAKMGATLERQEDYTFNGYPARSCYYMATTEGMELHSRFDYILVKPAFYQIAFVGLSVEEIDKPDIQEFFKSFTLMK